MAKPIVIPALSIDPDDPAPKYQQIRRELTRQIEAGILTPGTRLPGIRKLAQLLSVSPDTVKRVFDDLADEGYLKSIPRSGFVVDRLPDVRPVPKTSDPAPFPLGPRHSSETAALAAAALRDYSPAFSNPAPFVGIATGMASDPDPVWTRLSSQLVRMTWRHTGYSDPRGYGPLRETLSDLLRRLRGIAADPEDIIITTGSVQTASIASQILFSAGDTVCVESPGLKLVSDVLAFRGCRVKKIPVDTDGILTSVVEADWNTAGVYVTSACQYPLGFELSSDRRSALLRWALKTGGWIIEDDYNSFLRVSESVSAPIRSIAGAESCTVFLASFSTTIFPGVRIGFAAVPHEVSDAFAGAKLLTDRHNPENLQAVLSEYIRCGAWDSHVRKLARRYRERYRFFMEAAGKRLSPFGEFSETKSGKHAVFFLNPAIRDTEAAVILEKSGIFVRTLSVISDPARPMNGFLFGYAYPPETVIPALDRVREVLTSLALRKKA